MKIYLNNGATTKVDDKVVRAMLPYFSNKYGNASAIGLFGQEAKNALDWARKTIAKSIGAKFDEIIFTSGGSESNNLAIKGTARAYKDKGNHIITSKFEHHSVLNACKSLEEEGFSVTYLDVDKDGFIGLEELKKAITDKTILVTIMHANNEIGVIEPIEEIGRICKEKEVLFHTDAVQSYTKVPIDVRKINVDLISLNAHKMHGPKGVGALYVRTGVKLKKMIDGGEHESNLRAGTENIPGVVGFATAAKLMNKKDIEKITKLRDKLINGIFKEIPDIKLNGSREKRLCNNVSISFKGAEAESIGAYLNSKGIETSSGSACSSKSLEPSHVLLAIGLKPELANTTIRFTLSKFTSDEEIDYTLKVLPSIIKRLRRISPLFK